MNIKDNVVLSDELLERHRVRRVPLGDNLVFLFDSEPKISGRLSCTMLVEGDSAVERLQTKWMDIARHIYVRTPTDLIIRANQISASVLNGSNSPVQHLIFDTEGQVPVSIGCDDPDLMIEVYFPFDVLRALSDDLGAREPSLIDVAF